MKTDIYDDDGWNESHTLAGFDCSGDDTLLLVAGFNRNPESDVDSMKADGDDMTLEGSSINANVCSIQAYSHKINNSDFDIVCSTPDYRQQGMIAIGIEDIDQTTPVEDTKGAGGWGTDAQTTYTGTEGNLLLVFVTTQNDRTATASGVTELRNFNHSGQIGLCFAGHVTATGSEQTVGATINEGDNFRVVVIELNIIDEEEPEPTEDKMFVKVDGVLKPFSPKVKVGGQIKSVKINTG